MINFAKKDRSDGDYIRYLCRSYEKATPEEKLKINNIISEKAQKNSYLDKRGKKKKPSL